MRCIASIAGFGLCSAFACGQVVSASFQFIEESGTGNYATSANDMSPDGRWVIGGMDTSGDGRPDTGYRWDRENDVFTLIPSRGLPTGTSTINAISDDGQVILGNIPGPPGFEEQHEAAIWTEATGWTGLGWLPNAGTCPSRSSGFELSADGTIATGLSWDGCSGRAFYWTAATGMVELQNLGNGGNRATVLSADGSMIAGFAQGNSRTPAMWDGITFTGELFDPTFDIGGEFHGMSDDGSVVLGAWWMGGLAFEAGKIVDGVPSKIGNGAIITGWQGIPQDIADNGTIVGFDILVGNRRSWIQPFGEGDLQETVAYINNHGADIDPALRLEVIQAISTDGRHMIGHGFGTGAWLISLEYACPADLTGDGFLNIFDVFAFLDLFNAKDLAADLTGDEILNIFDVFAFLDLFNAGCP